MKKNILYLVIDSVTNDVIFDPKLNVAPFLRELRKKSITGNNMYSEAPYTEAALQGLVSSVHTMDNDGYLCRLKGSKTFLETFKENGYKTFHCNYYPTIYPSYMMPGSVEKKYIEGFDFEHVWEYRLKYYGPLYLEKKTTLEENNMLKNMMIDNFNGWIEYYSKIKNNDKELSMIINHIDKTDIKENIKKVQKEKDLFLKNSNKYFIELFNEKENHRLFQINKYKMNDKIHDDNFRKETCEKYRYIFDRINRMNRKLNLRNNRFPFKKLLKLIFRFELRKIKGLLLGYKNSIIDKDLYERIDYNYDKFKNQVSFNTIANTFIEFAKDNRDENFVAYLHFDDAHFNEMFFTYDTTDRNLLDSEFDNVSKYLDSIPKDYKGSITSDLSLNYCDNIIKNIFNKLEELKLLDDTYVVITADHGFSFRFCPVREAYVNTFYKENYNVPFLIYGTDIKPKVIPGFCQTYDLPATLLDLVGLKEERFIGKSLLDFNGREYANLEYMGGGCPDINRRPVNLGVRTREYSVSMNVFLDREFNESELVSVYDMLRDPYEHNDLSRKKNIRNKINKEISLLEKRYNELKK